MGAPSPHHLARDHLARDRLARDRLPGGPPIARPALAPAGRPGGFNWISMWTLYRRGVWSYLKIWKMTLIGPAVTKLLYLSAFGLAAGGALVSIGGLPMATYIVPGLIGLGMALGAFQHPAYMLLFQRIEGSIADDLMAPMQAWERTVAYLATGVTTGLVAGAVITLMVALILPPGLHDPLALLLFATLGCLVMSAAGVLTGLSCDKWDKLSAVETFLVTPLAFLSGTFFALADVPEPWRSVLGANPMLFAIDGMRYGLTGVAQIDLTAGALGLLAAALVLAGWSYLRVARQDAGGR